jgi:hypothetical protein
VRQRKAALAARARVVLDQEPVVDVQQGADQRLELGSSEVRPAQLEAAQHLVDRQRRGQVFLHDAILVLDADVLLDLRRQLTVDQEDQPVAMIRDRLLGHAGAGGARLELAHVYERIGPASGLELAQRAGEQVVL